MSMILLMYLRRCVASLRDMHARARARHELGELLRLDNRLVKDMGITRMEAIQEANKPFWRK